MERSLKERKRTEKNAVPNPNENRASHSQVGQEHSIRIKTEDKEKVVSAVWGTELSQFLAALL